MFESAHRHSLLMTARLDYAIVINWQTYYITITPELISLTERNKSLPPHPPNPPFPDDRTRNSDEKCN